MADMPPLIARLNAMRREAGRDLCRSKWSWCSGTSGTSIYCAAPKTWGSPRSCCPSLFPARKALDVRGKGSGMGVFRREGAPAFPARARNAGLDSILAGLYAARAPGFGLQGRFAVSSAIDNSGQALRIVSPASIMIAARKINWLHRKLRRKSAATCLAACGTRSESGPSRS